VSSYELGALLDRVEAQYDSDDYYKRTRRNDIKRAIDAWCDVMGWPRECAAIGHQHINSVTRLIGRIAYKIYGKISILHRHEEREFEDESGEALAKMERKEYLLIAFGVAAIGYALYVARRNSVARTDIPPTELTPTPVRERWKLVLVMNAAKQATTIEALRVGGTLSSGADAMFEATQALWFGRASSGAYPAMDALLSRTDDVSVPTEYDVHLVGFDLEGDEPGFRAGVDYMSRLDAFQALCKRGAKPRLSVRLPAEAYGVGGFYKR
jgi:hypothetical protein